MYQIKDGVASTDDFIRLRLKAGLTPRSKEASEIGLPRSIYGVTVVSGSTTVGMGRIVGDGALNFEIVDVAVDPAHQGKGLGTMIMKRLMDYLETEASPGAYVTLMADVPEFYLKFGFNLSRPKSEGMYKII